jgi:two-component system sensor histidine kinase KdpD
MTRLRPGWLQWVAWGVATVIVTLVLLHFRDVLDKAHFALIYLLLVLGGSVAGGQRVGLALAAAAFLLFDWLFVPPYETLRVSNPLDWLVLVTFLVVSVVAARMLHRLQVEADVARARAAEIDRLAPLESLRETHRLQNALLASVSHDLRTPLTTIKAVAHDLVGVDDRAMVIEEEADRLNRMVSDLLDLSRVQSGITIAAVALTPIDDLVGAALQRVAGPLGERTVRVHLEEGGTLLVGRFDLTASLRILVNLLENANKYSPPGTPIGLAAVRRGEWIDLTVSDEGQGVPVAERERIFEPFYRPPGAPPDRGSAGLGLAIARGLAEAQGGTLRYAPRAGGGSEFTLSLPAAELPVRILTL